MMKSILMLLAAPLMASAFAPSILNSRVSTELGPHRNDPSAMFPNAERADAFRVVYNECDEEECMIVEAEKDMQGQWHANGHVQGEPVSREILMMECDDTN